MFKTITIVLLFLFFSSVCISQNRRKVDSLLQLVSKSADDTNKANAFYQLSRQYWNSSPDTTMLYASKLLTLSKKINHKRGIAGGYNSIGVAYSDQAKFDSAVVYYLLAVKVYTDMGNLQGAGMALNNIGVVYKKQGKLDEAIKYYIQSLKAAEDAGDKKSQVMTLNNISIIFRNRAMTTNNKAEFNTAIDYATRSLKIADENNIISGKGSVLTTLGTIYENTAQYDKAIKYYTEAIDIFKTLNEVRSIGVVVTNLGNVYFDLKNYDMAEQYYLDGLKTRMSTQDKNGVIGNYNNLGAVENKRRNFKKAYEYLQKAETIAKNIGANTMLRETYQAFYQTYENEGNYRSAFIYLKLYSDLKDSIVNSDNSNSIAQMQALYETEKKDKEIVLQKSEIKQKELESAKNESQRNMFIIASALMLVLVAAVVIGYRQKTLVEEQKRDIIDSIRYARRIQQSLLPTEKYIERVLKKLKDKK